LPYLNKRKEIKNYRYSKCELHKRKQKTSFPSFHRVMETFQGHSKKKIKTQVMFMDKIMTEAMSTVKFSSQVFRVLNEKNA